MDLKLISEVIVALVLIISFFISYSFYGIIQEKTKELDSCSDNIGVIQKQYDSMFLTYNNCYNSVVACNENLINTEEDLNNQLTICQEELNNSECEIIINCSYDKYSFGCEDWASGEVYNKITSYKCAWELRELGGWGKFYDPGTVCIKQLGPFWWKSCECASQMENDVYSYVENIIIQELEYIGR